MARLKEIAEKAERIAAERQKKLRNSLTPEECEVFDRWTEAKQAAVQLFSRRNRIFFELEVVIARGNLEEEARLSEELSKIKSSLAIHRREADELGVQFSELRDRVFLSSLGVVARRRGERMIARRDRELESARRTFDILRSNAWLDEERVVRVELARAIRDGRTGKANDLKRKLGEIEIARRTVEKQLFRCMERTSLATRRYERFIECMRNTD